MDQIPLTDDDRRELLRIARTTLREMIRMGEIPPGKPHRQSLLAPCAVFVALFDGETLRAAAGRFAASEPLYRAVQTMTVAAAMRHPRAAAVGDDEEPGLVVEVTVLPAGTAPLPIAVTADELCFADADELARLPGDRFDERSHPPRPRRRSTGVPPKTGSEPS